MVVRDGTASNEVVKVIGFRISKMSIAGARLHRLEVSYRTHA